jgi:hypothetical protein
MKAQFNQGDLSGWKLTLNNGTWDQSTGPARPKADPPTFSFPNIGPSGEVGLSAHPGKYWNPPQLPYMPVGQTTGNQYQLEKSIVGSKGGTATLKARCAALSYQFISIYITKKVNGVDECSVAGKAWNAPFPGTKAQPFTNWSDISFVVPAGDCTITIYLNSDANRQGTSVDIVNFQLPE